MAIDMVSHEPEGCLRSLVSAFGGIFVLSEWIPDKTKHFAGFSGSFLLFKFAVGTKGLPLRKGMVKRMIFITRLEQMKNFE